MTSAPPDTRTRDRLMAAMATCLAARGYRATTVADIVREAKTSRRSFYAEFTDKADCFVAVLRRTNQQIIDAVAAAIDPTSPWTEQIRQAVTAYVEAQDRHPELTLCWIRELPALGDAAGDLKTEGMDAWIDLFVAITSTPEVAAEGIAPVSRLTGVMVWGGIRELTADCVENGRPLATIIEPATAACIALLTGGATAAPGR